MSLDAKLLALLPADPSQQLEFAFRIIQNAFQARASQSDGETAQLKAQVLAGKQHAKSLERRLAALESDLAEANDRARVAAELEARAQAEKQALALAVKKQQRELAKMEGLKRTLISTLQDDERPAAEGRNDATLASLLQEQLFGPSPASTGAGRGGHDGSAAPTPVAYRESPAGSAYGLPLTPPPSRGAAGGRGGDLFGDFAMPSPFGNSPPPPGTPGSGAGGAGGNGATPGGGSRSPKLDGKEFFRQARARLSYEDFSAFLQTIKDLNAHRQSREDALKKAAAIFGPRNSDLHAAFEGLLSRHLPC